MDNEKESNKKVTQEEESKQDNIDKLKEMDDDESIIEIDELAKKNDEILERDYLSSLIEQENNLIYYEVENIYKSDKKKVFKGKFALKKSPPILVIKDDNDNEASFILTENFTEELVNTLEQVKKAYYGFSGPSKLNAPTKFIDKIGFYAKENPIKVLVPIILIVIFMLLFR